MEAQNLESFDQKLERLKELIRNLDEVYDAQTYLGALLHQTGQMDYFYRNYDPNDVYRLGGRRPEEGEVAYFNLDAGFPKELQGGHWCYILSDMKSKMLVIPMCSVKAEMLQSGTVTHNKYIEYVNLTFENGISTVSKMSYSDMRSIDIQRIDLRKPFARIDRCRQDIADKAANIMLGAEEHV